MFDSSRLIAVYNRVRDDLLAERNVRGHWTGELASSSLSTATAVSALALVERHDPTDPRTGKYLDESHESELNRLIVGGLEWLANQQNEDGGWGDTDKSYSNISTTYLVVAAFHLTGVPARHRDLLERAQEYIERQGGVPALERRYGKDRTFAIPILTNCAIADLVEWSEVSPLPFEFACLPQSFYRWARLPVVSYAIPALVAVGQANYFRRKPWNPITRFVRGAAVSRSLEVLERIQPESGGFLEAIPLTSFVVMSLAATGRVSHSVVQRGVQFLQASARSDGSWPIDTNLATWNTTLAVNALAAGEQRGCLDSVDCWNWLLGCQNTSVHAYTGAAPGGWGWSDLSGAVPDADDTPGAMLALNQWRRFNRLTSAQRDVLHESVQAGARWLLELQNSDGGWPTFCRGWGKLPFDRSGADLTAHALRALHAWIDRLDRPAVERATSNGLEYLSGKQNPDGSWTPLWFGNQDHPSEENRCYGTSKVLLAYRDLKIADTLEAQRGFNWLVAAQNADGGWGDGKSSVEETALVVEALLANAHDPGTQDSLRLGLEWLCQVVEDGRHREASPIGFYFSKLWYHERLYPLLFTTSALGRAALQLDAFARVTSKPELASLAQH